MENIFFKTLKQNFNSYFYTYTEIHDISLLLYCRNIINKKVKHFSSVCTDFMAKRQKIMKLYFNEIYKDNKFGMYHNLIACSQSKFLINAFLKCIVFRILYIEQSYLLVKGQNLV